MDYERMWKTLKAYKQELVDKYKASGKTTGPDYVRHLSVIHLMNHYENCEKNGTLPDVQDRITES